MSATTVTVKHQGKKYDVEVEPDSTGETFKYQLYSLTGVEPERQKILVKGGQLKDETALSTLGLKSGQMLMMMGTPSGSKSIVERPREMTRFIEDMTEAEAAQSAGAIPAGLQNLGNTCYMNATIQTLKSIPELQQELSKQSPQPSDPSAAQSAFSFLAGASSDLTQRLGELFKQMSETQDSFPPMAFLNTLRTVFPQFAQKARDGHGYAQQDAEEAWSQILTQLRQKLNSNRNEADAPEYRLSFIDQYMAGRFETVLECDEPAAKDAGEQAIESTEAFLKLNCHINMETNHLRQGIASGLVEKIEKTSSSLNRDAVYTKRSTISRLPKYLTVHFMRFDWRRDTNKKAKIMRKVTFPQELDVVEFCNQSLQAKLAPIRNKFREVRGIEEDHERARKRQKRLKEDESRALPAEPSSSKNKSKDKVEEKDKDIDTNAITFKTDAEVEAERASQVLQAKKALLALVQEEQGTDPSTNQTGLYELHGIITHQGASADSGHYTAFVRKQAHTDENGKKLDDGKWWWFNDEKVTGFDSSNLETLAGGGQSHSALILLYQAVPLPTIEQESVDADNSS